MMRIYSIYDSKAEAFITPFFAETQGVAWRMFGQAAQDVNHQFHKFAGDYTLFEIGEWDQFEGQIKPHSANKNIGTALQIKTLTNNEGP